MKFWPRISLRIWSKIEQIIWKWTKGAFWHVIINFWHRLNCQKFFNTQISISPTRIFLHFFIFIFEITILIQITCCNFGPLSNCSKTQFWSEVKLWTKISICVYLKVAWFFSLFFSLWLLDMIHILRRGHFLSTSGETSDKNQPNFFIALKDSP